MKGESGTLLVLEKLNRVSELLTNLEEEAIKAKKTDADLFQRKNKLIPKFHEMRTVLRRRLCELRTEGFVGADVPEEMFSDGVDGVENSTSASPSSTHSPIPASIGGNLMNSAPKGLVEPPQQFPDFSGQIFKNPDFQGLCGGILKNSDFSALSGGILKNADFSGIPKNFGISSMLM